MCIINFFTMKKAALTVLWLSLVYLAAAQDPVAYGDRLYKLCKVWGFLKYYHSEVSNCRRNWDSVLLATVPLVKNAADDAAFDAALNGMVDAAGTMALPLVPPKELAPGFDINLDFGWIHKAGLSAQLAAKLDTVKSRFRPYPNCFVGQSYAHGWLDLDDSVAIVNPYSPD